MEGWKDGKDGRKEGRKEERIKGNETKGRKDRGTKDGRKEDLCAHVFGRKAAV